MPRDLHPRAEYPSTAEWLAVLDHAGCRRNLDGTGCHGVHCVFCGAALDGGGMVPCSCGGARNVCNQRTR